MKLLSFSFTQLFPFTEMIRGDKNDLISSAVLLFLVSVYAHLACLLCSLATVYDSCKWYIALLLGDLATYDIASVWEPAKLPDNSSDYLQNIHFL